MKLTIRLALLMMIVWRSDALAVDPIESFAKGLLARLDVDDWWGLNGGKPGGGYLIKFEHDITADGRDEIFLASSLEGGTAAYSWTVYRPDAQQNYTKIISEIFISPVEGFYLKATGPQPELQTVYADPKFRLGIINRCTIHTSGSVTRIKQELSAEEISRLDADDWKVAFGIGKEIKPTVSKVLMAEFAKDRLIPWRPYKNDLEVTSQELDPADSSAIAAIKMFTLESAKQLLNVPRNEKAAHSGNP